MGHVFAFGDATKAKAMTQGWTAFGQGKALGHGLIRVELASKILVPDFLGCNQGKVMGQGVNAFV